MSVNDQDQPLAGPMVIGGVVAVGGAVALKAAAPANSVYTFTANYVFHWRNGPITYRHGNSYTLDVQLKAALLAAAAPMVAA